MVISRSRVLWMALLTDQCPNVRRWRSVPQGWQKRIKDGLLNAVGSRFQANLHRYIYIHVWSFSSGHSLRQKLLVYPLYPRYKWLRLPENETYFYLLPCLFSYLFACLLASGVACLLPACVFLKAILFLAFVGGWYEWTYSLTCGRRMENLRHVLSILIFVCKLVVKSRWIPNQGSFWKISSYPKWIKKDVSSQVQY